MERKEYLKTVIAGCIHWPYTKKEEFEKWLDFLRVFQPEKLYLLGSLIHSNRLVKKILEKKLDSEKENLQKQLADFYKNVLARIRQTAPKAEIFYLQGATEKNLSLWCKANELSFQDEVLKALKLEELKINYIPEGKLRVGKFLLTHGKYSQKDSVSSAKAELKERGISGCSVCSHHVGAHYKTDYRGEMAWFEVGCLAKDGVKEPGMKARSAYSERGFLVGYFSQDSDRFHMFPALFNTDIVIKKNGKEQVFFETLNGEIEKEVLVGCLHFPDVHKPSFNSFLEFLKEFQPDKIQLTGDFWDLSQLAWFKTSKVPQVQADLEKDIKAVKKGLRQIRQACPKAKIFYHEGNHEARVMAFLLDHAPGLYKWPTRDEKLALRIPETLDLASLDISWIPRNNRKEYGFLIIHGDYARKNSGETAKAELEAKGISGASSHCHRMGYYAVTDELGTRTWYELGTLTRYDLHWGKGKWNWQRGFAVLYRKKGESKKFFHLIPVPIVNGKIVFCGKPFGVEKIEEPEEPINPQKPEGSEKIVV